MEKIEEKLGADRALLRPMEEALNAMGGMEYDWMTRQAFRDCMYLLRYMDAFSLPDWEVEARAWLIAHRFSRNGNKPAGSERLDPADSLSKKVYRFVKMHKDGSAKMF